MSFNAQINLVGAQYDGYVGIFRLLEAMGRLTPERIVPGLEDTSSIGVYEDGEFELATMSDQQTVDLVTLPLGEATVISMDAIAPPTAPAVSSVQIAASSDPITWSPGWSGVGADRTSRRSRQRPGPFHHGPIAEFARRFQCGCCRVAARRN